VETIKEDVGTYAEVKVSSEYQMETFEAERELSQAERQQADDDLATWYRHAVALVYPSRYEGFGMPLLEAMQSGCPVLASNASSLPEVVGDAGLLLDPGQPDDWASAIGQLVADPALRHKLSAAGQNWAREFTWTRCAGQVAAIYQRVLHDANSR